MADTNPRRLNRWLPGWDVARGIFYAAIYRRTQMSKLAQPRSLTGLRPQRKSRAIVQPGLYERPDK